VFINKVLQGFGCTIGVKAQKENIFFILSFYEFDLASRQKKDIYQFERQICHP
jgi:hypothetical protein